MVQIDTTFFQKRGSITYKASFIPEKYKSIYSVLDKIPKSLELIAHNLNLPLKEIQSKLTLMEMEDLVIKFSNSQWALK